MSYNHHWLMIGAFQVGHACQQVHSAFKDIVGLSVIQSQRGYTFADEFLRHTGVGAGPGSAEPAAGPTDPDDRPVGVWSAVQDCVETSPTGPKAQTFTYVTVREVNPSDIFYAHQFFLRLRLTFWHI
jgi:hypothetical protein